MKTVTVPSNGVDCRCGKATFIVETPQGGDYATKGRYATCPLCKGMCDSEIRELFDLENSIEYCEECGILFERGCVHSSNGCTDDVCYAQLIKGYGVPKLTYLKDKGATVVYTYTVGMPVFESYEECVRLSSTHKYEWVCMCYVSGGSNCSLSTYPYDKYPEYYDINEQCINKHS